ncbi:MAG: hypothetical protein LAT75_02525 [Candidatus Cyclonatronum sp.]|uniref:hypothetical protein n=1 Tax=Cyclonatronum sp. TaxID=3024185 RepID=UPI0025BCEC71|nr:hypothetical protein [Cyclonatronum sp.]MCC5933037.1 hypothetical protein [Balneolales bacterium]MCH8485710.1 hypothetical protein [Cyclonatronum sp.]
MSEERERLKEEYKQHYRQILEDKKRLAAAERKSRVLKSFQEIDTRPVLESFQDALGAVRERIVQAEARLEVWLDNRDADTASSGAAPEDMEAFEQKEKARQTLAQIRAEMGTIERQLDEKAAAITGAKTIADTTGTPGEKAAPAASREKMPEPDPVRLPEGNTKTIGRNEP